MLKWTGTGSKGKIIGLGLEERNLELLRSGKPIHITGAEMNLPFDILIYYGKDMSTLLEVTKEGIGPDTIVYDKRRR